MTYVSLKWPRQEVVTRSRQEMKINRQSVALGCIITIRKKSHFHLVAIRTCHEGWRVYKRLSTIDCSPSDLRELRDTPGGDTISTLSQVTDKRSGCLKLLETHFHGTQRSLKVLGKRKSPHKKKKNQYLDITFICALTFHFIFHTKHDLFNLDGLLCGSSE